MSADGSLPARHEIGGNNPPEPTPFELAQNAIEDLSMEAKNWLDGGTITTQHEADCVGTLKDSLRRSIADADAARTAENKPFDEGKAEVQKRYAPLIAETKAQTGKAVLALQACNAALTSWLRKVDAEKKAKAAAAQAEADAIAAKAAEAMRAAAPTDLAAREDAEALVVAAKEAATEASRASRDRAHVTGGARATGLRTFYVPVLTDVNSAVKHYWQTNPDAFDGFVMSLAKVDVAAGKRQIPGFDVVDEARVV